MTQNIEIYFPIVSDYVFEEYPFEQKEFIINEIKEIIGSADFSEYKYLSKCSITLSYKYKKDVSNLIIQNLNKYYLIGFDEDCLNFSFSSKINLDNYEVIQHQGEYRERITDKEELELHLPYSLAEIFGNYLFEILVLSQISRPGSLKLREGIIWINGKRNSKIIPQIINLRHALEYRTSKGYPMIDFVSFPKYYDWLKVNNLVFPEFPKNSYQEAINNFSHSNGEANIITRIIYQMMTLEQLYIDNASQICDQLNIKIQTYLGTLASHKKQIKNMYNIRSRFLHGNLPILPLHKEDYEIVEFLDLNDEFNEADNLSQLLIVSTLQKMYSDNLLDLKFEYILKMNQ